MEIIKYQNKLGRKHQIVRLVFNIVWALFARPLPRRIGNSWKILILRMFGAQVSKKAVVYSTAKIYYPANLIMEEYACLASNVDCYNVDLITVGKGATVSQGAYLCTAGHNVYSNQHELITAPITIKEGAWIAADAFIGMGITIGEGAVVGARAAVFKNIEPWDIVGGNPAKFLKKRVVKQ